MIIGIIGRKGAGKDTVATMIQESLKAKNLKMERRQIAFNLKKACAALVDKSISELENNQTKNAIYQKPLVLDCDSVLSFLNHFGISSEKSANIYEYLKDLNFSKTINSHRELLQFMGTNILRNLVGENVHIDSVSNSVPDSDVLYIVTDVRFENEASSLKKLSDKVLLLGLHRDGVEMDNHPSESGIEALISKHADFTIFNNGSLSDLNSKISSLVKRLF